MAQGRRATTDIRGAFCREHMTGYIDKCLKCELKKLSPELIAALTERLMKGAH